MIVSSASCGVTGVSVEQTEISEIGAGFSCDNIAPASRKMLAASTTPTPMSQYSGERIRLRTGLASTRSDKKSTHRVKQGVMPCSA